MTPPTWLKARRNWRVSWWKWRREWKSWLETQHSKNKDYGIWSHHFMANRRGNNGNSERLYYLGLQNHCRWWVQPWNEKTFAPWKKSCVQPRQHIKKQRHYFADKILSNQSYGFSTSHMWMWKLDYKESWELKNWCFWTVVLEKILKSSLESKEIQPVNPKGNQSWLFFGRINIEAEAPIFWPPDAENWLTGKVPDAGERLKVGGEADNRGWDGWMISPTWWTWVWASSRSWWWTGKSGMLQSMGLQSQTLLSDWSELIISLY